MPDQPIDRLLDMAKALAGVSEPGKRRTTLALLRDSIAPLRPGEPGPSTPRCKEADILECAYGDPAGRAYWTAWLDHELLPRTLGELLAVHLAVTQKPVRRHVVDLATVFQNHRAALFAALGVKVFAAAGPPIDPRAAVERLLKDQDTARLVPAALVRVILAAPSPVEAERPQPEKKTRARRLPQATKRDLKRLITKCKGKLPIPSDITEFTKGKLNRDSMRALVAAERLRRKTIAKNTPTIRKKSR